MGLATDLFYTRVLLPAFFYTLTQLLLLLPPSWCRQAGDPVSTVFHSRHYTSSAHRCTWTSWFYTQSAQFPVSGITSLQYLTRGRVLPIKVFASDSSAMLLGPRSTLQTSSFLPSVSHAGDNSTYRGLCMWLVCASDYSAMLLRPWITLQTSSFLPTVSHTRESFTYQGLRIWLFGYITWTLDFSANFILLAFSISRGGEFYLSSLRTWLVCASDSSAILLGPKSILRTSSFLSSVSHAGESFTYQGLHIWFFSYLDLGVRCSPRPFCPQYLTRRTSLTKSALSPFFLQGFRDFTEAIQGFGRHLIRRTIILPWLTLLTNSVLSPFFLQGFRGFTEAVQGFGHHLIRRTIVLPWLTLLPLAFTRFAFPSRAKNISGGEHLKRTVHFPHFCYKVLGGLPRLVKALDVIQCRENINFLLPIYL